MRVALISPLFESVPPRLYGGTERVVYHLCRGLTEANVEVTLFASGDSFAEGTLVPVIDESLRLRPVPVADPVAYHLKMLAEVARRASEFDVIHNHHDYWMLPLSEMTQTPVLTTLHGRLDLPDFATAFGAFPHNHFVSISNAQRRPAPWLNWAATIHHGIAARDFEFREKPGKYLAFLGRMSPEKRPDLAIEIAKRSGVPLKMAAKIDGKKDQDFFDAYVKNQIDGKFIEYVGEISESEKSEFLGNALALAFPIDWPEPFGLVVVESLACGTPVLARACGSMPELLKDGVTGYCHDDVKVLADRVAGIESLSRRKCREWVESKFSLSRMTEDYIHVYRRLAERRAHRADRYRWNFLHSVERAAHGNS